jgi:hypothetical protein
MGCPHTSGLLLSGFAGWQAAPTRAMEDFEPCFRFEGIRTYMRALR